MKRFADPAEIWNLAQRQVIIALTRQPDQSSPGVILFADSGKKIAELDRGMLLREALADNQVEHERLRIEATDFLRMPFPGRNEAAFIGGQSKSMFIITNRAVGRNRARITKVQSERTFEG